MWGLRFMLMVALMGLAGGEEGNIHARTHVRTHASGSAGPELWTAAHSNETYPEEVRHVAMMFLVHRCAQFEKVWERWVMTAPDPSRYHFYIHQDGMTSPGMDVPYTAFDTWSRNNQRRVHFTPHVQAKRWSWELVHATLLLLREALKSPENECFVLLSETAMPVASPLTLERRLFSENGCVSTLRLDIPQANPRGFDIYVQTQWQVFSRTDVELILRFLKISFRHISNQVLLYRAAGGYHSYDEIYFTTALRYIHENATTLYKNKVREVIRIEEQTHILWFMETVQDSPMVEFFFQQGEGILEGHPLNIRATLFQNYPMVDIRKELFRLSQREEGERCTSELLFVRKVIASDEGQANLTCREQIFLASTQVDLKHLHWT